MTIQNPKPGFGSSAILASIVRRPREAPWPSLFAPPCDRKCCTSCLTTNADPWSAGRSERKENRCLARDRQLAYQSCCLATSTYKYTSNQEQEEEFGYLSIQIETEKKFKSTTARPCAVSPQGTESNLKRVAGRCVSKFCSVTLASITRFTG